MGAIKELKVKISADAKGLNGALNGLSDDISELSSDFEGLNKLGEGFKNVGQKMTLIGAGIVASIGGIVAKGSEWSAQVEGQKFLYNNLDKEVQKSISSNSKNAEAIGLTAQQYRNGATDISTYYKNMGLTAEETAKLSGKTMDLVADLGAVKDVPFDEALADFKSALMGNYEAVDKYGISLSASTLENSEFVKSLDKSWKELSDNEKMMAAYNEMVRQGASAQGLAKQEAESFGMKFKLLKQQISETVGEIGANLLPVLEPLVQKFSEVATKVSEWVKENPKLTQGILVFVGIIGTLMVVLGPLIALIGVGITTFTTLSAVAGVLGVSIGALCAPVLLVIGAIVALIAIGVALWQNWDTVKAKASELGKYVSDKFNELKTNVSNKINELKTDISNKFNELKTNITNKINEIKNNISKTWSNIKSTTSSIWNSIKSSISSVWNNIKSLASSIFNGIKSVISNAWNGIKSTTSNVCNGIKSTVSNVFSGLKNVVSNAMNSIRSTVSSIWNSVRSIFSSVLKPNIKMPKISISGKFNLNPPSVPKFGISWYSKGAIFKRPTVLGGMGVGDAHNGIGSNAEAILPINQLPKLLGLDKQQATNNITINSNRPLSPSEIAREAIKAQRRLSYGF